MTILHLNFVLFLRGEIIALLAMLHWPQMFHWSYYTTRLGVPLGYSLFSDWTSSYKVTKCGFNCSCLFWLLHLSDYRCMYAFV